MLKPPLIDGQQDDSPLQDRCFSNQSMVIHPLKDKDNSLTYLTQHFRTGHLALAPAHRAWTPPYRPPPHGLDAEPSSRRWASAAAERPQLQRESKRPRPAGRRSFSPRRKRSRLHGAVDVLVFQMPQPQTLEYPKTLSELMPQALDATGMA